MGPAGLTFTDGAAFLLRNASFMLEWKALLFVRLLWPNANAIASPCRQACAYGE